MHRNAALSDLEHYRWIAECALREVSPVGTSHRRRGDRRELAEAVLDLLLRLEIAQGSPRAVLQHATLAPEAKP